jgi:tetratricopeptide (TPR) repeat protein
MKRSVHTSVTVALGILALSACATAVPAGHEGQVMYNAGNYLAAADAFTDEIREHPRSAAAWNNRAVARVRLGDLDGAMRDYNRAVTLETGDPELYFNRGNALVAAGQYSHAIMDYDRAIELNPTYSRALFNRGAAYALAGQPEPARRDWQAAVALEADPYTRSAMRRSVGLEPAAPRVAAPPVAGQPTTATTVAPPPPLGTAPGAPPLPVVPPPSAVAGAPRPDPAASPSALDARALTIRGLSREVDGDHAGAMQDLNAALALEPDAERREGIARLIRLLDPPR